MRSTKNGWRQLAFASVLMCFLTACGGGSGSGGPDPAPPVPMVELGSLTGRVADSQTGEALDGVTVKVGSLKATSDSSGKYTLVGVPASANVVVQFSKAEYAVNYATVDVVKDQASVADRRLARIGIKKPLSVEAGGTVGMDNSPAQVQLPPSGLVTASGAAATGTVSVEMTPIDPGINPLNMPGNFRAQGEAAPIESMGALQVEIRDAAGALLNLAPGKFATIRIPVPVGAKSPPPTMPLYYFKESTGLWVREGSAALAGTAPQQYYEGQVAHFTTWNADRSTETIFIKGCVLDEHGQPIVATVTSSGIDYYGTSSAPSAMPEGLFKVPARRDSRVVVTARRSVGTVSVDATTGSTDLTLPACLVVEQKPPVIIVQPADLTLAPGAIDALSVLATEGSEYQWYKNGEPLSSRAPSLLIVGDGSATGDYAVVAKNADGTVTSRTVKVKVAVPVLAPVFSVQPQNVSVLEGASAQFSIQAQGDSLGYQWLRNGVEINGATGPVLTLDSATLADSGAQFKCRVSNIAGSVLSDTVALTVTSQAIAVGIAQHPMNASVSVGQRATFTVLANGTGPFTYQWLLNGAAVPNATSATYQTPATVLTDSGAHYTVQVTNAKARVTSNPASLTVSASTGINGLHLFFLRGQTVGNSYGIGAVPAVGGSPVSLASQATLLTAFPEATATNGGFVNFYWRNILMAQNQRLYRQDMIATAGLSASVPISTLTATSTCGGFSGHSDGGFASDGFDLVDSLKSWNVFRKPGPDGNCQTKDDTFVAVRMNMAATDNPLAVAQPVAAIHSANGALTGWLLRQGQQMQRVNADFSNPVADFTLPANDLIFDDGAHLLNTFVFSSGSTIYAADLSAPAPTTPTQVASLGAGEFFSYIVQGADGQTLLVAIHTGNATRVVRYNTSSKSSIELGTVPGLGNRLMPTPTRMVAQNNSNGTLTATPLQGGQAQTIFTPATPNLSMTLYQAGERIWLQSGDAVVSVNSDGTGQQTLPGARLAACVSPPAVLAWDEACDAVIVVQGATARAYDGATGTLRVTYGNVSIASPPLVSTISFSNAAWWGQGMVLNQLVYNPANPEAQAFINYYIKTDQPGITQLLFP
jgi:hypothetical protein